MTIKLLGIKNCDTVRKARNWLKAHDIEFEFQDIRDEVLSKKEWTEIVKNADSDKIVNTRGTSWRKLSDTEKDTSSNAKIINLLSEHPTVMKRPLLISGKTYHIGFKPDEYEKLFA
ncbi:MAG: Spx/MgsR family RNA polymerase-binding regulatory protein [Gammaproteobacteria bacterium]|nr:Spx/MgsR family RNA polymerase-binding regulatory protein [Gammaproteobacteria bacterium]NNC97825.1 Spx/MgsR family RNA polymerase-binding regulatory protein [Gammaproteobacteria bacterium]NNM13698.1 Spx/MgsR family RNA polymerase-binding regulatory protein [Gammaproteobacteria bacterium]